MSGIEVLARAGIFQGLTHDTVATLTDQLEPIEFPDGHTLFVEGDPGDRLYIVIDGKVRIGRCTPDGHESRLAIMGPADMFGELALFDVQELAGATFADRGWIRVTGKTILIVEPAHLARYL